MSASHALHPPHRRRRAADARARSASPPSTSSSRPSRRSCGSAAPLDLPPASRASRSCGASSARWPRSNAHAGAHACFLGAGRYATTSPAVVDAARSRAASSSPPTRRTSRRSRQGTLQAIFEFQTHDLRAHRDGGRERLACTTAPRPSPRRSLMADARSREAHEGRRSPTALHPQYRATCCAPTLARPRRSRSSRSRAGRRRSQRSGSRDRVDDETACRRRAVAELLRRRRGSRRRRRGRARARRAPRRRS